MLVPSTYPETIRDRNRTGKCVSAATGCIPTRHLRNSFKVYGSVYRKYIPIYIQQDATLHFTFDYNYIIQCHINVIGRATRYCCDAVFEVLRHVPMQLLILFFVRFLCRIISPLNAELNPICYLLALWGVHHFLHVSRIRVKSLTLRLLMSFIYGAPILDVSRSHTTTQHSR